MLPVVEDPQSKKQAFVLKLGFKFAWNGALAVVTFGYMWKSPPLPKLRASVSAAGHLLSALHDTKLNHAEKRKPQNSFEKNEKEAKNSHDIFYPSDFWVKK